LVILASDPAIEGLFPGGQRCLDQFLPEQATFYHGKPPALLIESRWRPIARIDDRLDHVPGDRIGLVGPYGPSFSDRLNHWVHFDLLL
jgi:hypothetical protein